MIGGLVSIGGIGVRDFGGVGGVGGVGAIACGGEVLGMTVVVGGGGASDDGVDGGGGGSQGWCWC